jgi:hypothetical protein
MGEITRRGFVRLLAAALPLVAMRRDSASQLVPTLYGDGTHDDTKALQAWFDNEPVMWLDGTPVNPRNLSGYLFRLSAPIDASRWLAWQRAGRAPRYFKGNEVSWRDDGRSRFTSALRF